MESDAIEPIINSVPLSLSEIEWIELEERKKYFINKFENAFL